MQSLSAAGLYRLHFFGFDHTTDIFQTIAPSICEGYLTTKKELQRLWSFCGDRRIVKCEKGEQGRPHEPLT